MSSFELCIRASKGKELEQCQCVDGRVLDDGRRIQLNLIVVLSMLDWFAIGGMASSILHGKWWQPRYCAPFRALSSHSGSVDGDHAFHSLTHFRTGETQRNGFEANRTLVSRNVEGWALVGRTKNDPLIGPYLF